MPGRVQGGGFRLKTKEQYVYNFMGDLFVCVSTFEEHLKLLGEVVRQLEMVGLTLTVKLSIWLKRKLNFGDISVCTRC
jgi:hypothetical protein